ncbi:MAG: hypothetical protein LUF87_09395 [Alistipes sp.]|nr:hypothetical protein [Alistipes sp.]
MKKLIPVLLLCTFAVSAARSSSVPSAVSPPVELRTRVDTVSYLLGSLYVRFNFTELEFFRETLDLEVFLAGISDGVYGTVMDLVYDEDELDDFLNAKYEAYRAAREAVLQAQISERMAAEGFFPLGNGMFYMIEREGTGPQATSLDQLVLFHLIEYDEDGDEQSDTRWYDGPEEATVEEMLDFFGYDFEKLLTEGALFRIRKRYYDSWYDYEDDYYEDSSSVRFDEAQFEILRIGEPQ